MEPAHPRPPMRHKVFWYRLDGQKGEAILFKYSPKYIYDLIIDRSGHTTQKWVSKVKSLKIVKAFSAFPLLRTKKKRNGIIPFLLNLLQRQRNYLKDIRGVDSSVLRYFPGKAHYVLNAENLMSWKSFYWLINLKSLRIMLENEANQDLKSPPKDLTKLPCQIQRFASHLRRLKKLKRVDLCVEKELSKITSLIFSKLKYSKDILKALTSLRIKMKTVIPEIMQTDDCPFFDIFQYATEFEFQDAQNAPPNVIMEHFGKFSNLEVLKLTLPFENHRNQLQAVQVSLQYLKNIGDLTKLVELKIILSWLSTQYSSEFFEFFQVPASLQKFSLTIVNPKLCELIDITNSKNWETNNPFDSSEVLMPFYQKWKNLEKLHSLSIRLENSDLLCIPNITFMIPMLPKIPYLKELVFEALVTPSPGLLKKPLPWCYLWEKLEHIRSEIETLIVKEAAITLKDFSWIKQQLKMKRLELGKYVIGGQNIDFLVKPLKKKDAIPAVEEVLLVDQFVIENDECFSRFLESFQKIPANIKLTMSADLRFVSREVLVEKLLEYIPKIHKNKKLDITFVNVCKALKKEDLKEIKKALIKHEAFCFLEIVSKGGRTVYLWDWKCHSKEKQENLINETGQEFRTWIAEHDISGNSSQVGAEMQEEEEGEELEEYEEYDYEEDDGENESQEFDDSDFDGCEEMEEVDAQDPVYNELDDIEKF